MKNNTQLSRIAVVIAALGATQLATAVPSGYAAKVSVNENVSDVRPEMLDWWWDNIRTQDRFVEWNPEAHTSYSLLAEPTDPTNLHYSVDTVQEVGTYIGGFPVTTVVTSRDSALASEEGFTHQYVAEVAFEHLEDLSFPGNAYLVYQYKVNETLDGSDVTATLHLPDIVERALPGFATSTQAHLSADITNLAAFLPDLFQQEFIEEELESRGTYRVEKNGFWLRTVIVDQEIKGLTPDMMNWWWDNIDTTARYKQWHPTAHLSFEWLEAPESPNNTTYSVGAVQRVVEYLGPYKNALLITWLPKEDALDRVEYAHWLYAKTDLDGLSGIMPQDMIHEYQMNDTGDGIVMRSTFNVPFFLNWVMPNFTDELGKHALQEMQMLQYFLPELFTEQALEQ